MANMIEQNPIAGASVYGVEQYSYTVNGVAGKDYAAALSAASFKEPRPSRRRSQSSRRLARTPRSSASACASSMISAR